ncbi:heme peroxidase, partial [Geopyxis carbonaria]
RNPACARWYPIRDHILQTLFSGRCTPLARAAVRLAFHDAATFSLARQAAGQPNGGADGSMLTDPAEVQRADNNGLQGIVAALAPLPARYNVSAGDIVQVAGTLAVIVCPGGPRVRTFVGRAPPPTIPAPDGLLPSTHAAVPVLLARFADMGFSVRDTMALMGAHSTALQQFVAAADANKTLDSTPDIWDVHFYEQTLNGTADPARVASLPSDVAFAGHESTKRAWARYVRDQDDWDEDYARAHLKMSLLGQETRGMVECTEVLP